VYLGAVTRAWSAHCAQTVTLRNVCIYLDRTHVRDCPGAKPLW